MKIVTSGPQYIDIDAYACMIAYAELLTLQGENSIAASSATLNESITPTIRSWHVELVTDRQPTASDEFILVDVSDPDYFDDIVSQANIIEILDHHPEFEQYWKDRLGTQSQIEFIGAACTLVYERWQEAGLIGEISTTSARLLTAGILDNTLNFQASITTQRDKDAYQELMNHADLSEDWPAQYFADCQDSIIRNLATAIETDTKRMHFPSIGHTIAIGQLVTWDAQQILGASIEQIQTVLSAIGPEWFINIVSICDGKSYFLASDATIQEFLHMTVHAVFDGSIGVANRMWLRKEIMKQDMDNHIS